MQPLNLSYLNTNGILGYDANSYLNGGVSVNPYGTPINATQQPDSFTKSQKTTETVKKVAVGVALTALAIAGFSKCSKGVSCVKNYWNKASEYVANKSDALLKFIKK